MRVLLSTSALWFICLAIANHFLLPTQSSEWFNRIRCNVSMRCKLFQPFASVCFCEFSLYMCTKKKQELICHIPTKIKTKLEEAKIRRVCCLLCLSANFNKTSKKKSLTKLFTRFVVFSLSCDITNLSFHIDFSLI